MALINSIAPSFLNHRFGLALPLGIHYAYIRIVMSLFYTVV
jgi:hypothetical protein